MLPVEDIVSTEPNNVTHINDMSICPLRVQVAFLIDANVALIAEVVAIRRRISVHGRHQDLSSSLPVLLPHLDDV